MRKTLRTLRLKKYTMKIIVPMAGRGSRLRPHTLTIPKPLIPIAGKPIVHRLVEDIAKVINLKNHDAAHHHINTKKVDKVAESIVLANFDEWVLSKLYPMTATIYEYDSRNKEKISTISHILVNK